VDGVGPVLIEDPRGRRWSVHRRWLGLRRPRWRGVEDPGFGNFGDVGGLGDDPLSAIVAVIGLILVLLFLVLFALPILIFGAELVLILAVAALGLAGRVLLGRPWTLEARSHDGRLVTRQAGGWRNSREALATLRDDAAAGRLLESDAQRALPSTPTRRALEAALACVLALLWLGGIGSLAAITVAVAVRNAPESGPWGLRIAVAALVLSAAGLLLTALVVLGLVSEHHRVA
jgi:hypothetical protein